jgi:hypothetical protein
MVFDNNALLGLAIRSQLDGIRRAIDSIDAVPRLSAGYAHTPQQFANDQLDRQRIRLEWHRPDRGHAVEATLVNLIKR